MTWEPDNPRPGFWMARVVKAGPMVASRIYVAHTTVDPVSGDPMERSPFLAAQIGLDIVRVSEVWRLVEFCESSPERQQLLIEPLFSNRAPRNGRARALRTAPLAKWRQTQAHRITAEQYEVEIRWLQWCSANNPTHPEFTYKKPIDRNALPIPRFP